MVALHFYFGILARHLLDYFIPHHEDILHSIRLGRARHLFSAFASQVEGIADDPFHPLARENSCLQRDLVRRSHTDPSSCASVFSLRVLAYHHEIKGRVAFEWRRDARKQACRAIVDVEIEALAQWQEENEE